MVEGFVPGTRVPDRIGLAHAVRSQHDLIVRQEYFDVRAGVVRQDEAAKGAWESPEKVREEAAAGPPVNRDISQDDPGLLDQVLVGQAGRQIFVSSDDLPDGRLHEL